MKIICISGKAQHGKDTTADLLKGILEQQGNRVVVYHYADLLKFICKSYFDWNGQKDEYGRTLLQHVGTDIVRTKDPDYWVDFAIKFFKLFEHEWNYVLIPDCRFPNEIELMQQNFDTIHLRVVRPNFDNGLSHEQQQHISEIALDDYKFDTCLLNDGTPKTFLNKITEFANTLK